MKRWEEIFTEADRILLKKTGLGSKQEPGNRPALLIIDVTRAFLGSTSRPVLESVEEYRTSCGEAGWRALPNIQKLLESCRANHIPVVFTTGDAVTRPLLQGAVKGAGAGSVAFPGTTGDLKGDEIPEQIAPLPSELVIRKSRASAFFGSSLVACLRSMNIESLLIAGVATSGCVRASVVDAFSYGFRCSIVEECTFDRIELSHLVSLFDMNAKYADVITLDEALNYVGEVGASRRKATVTARAESG